MKNLAASGMTMIIVTHEIQFARDIAGTVAVMADGIIIERGPAQNVFSRPQDPRTKAFLLRSLRSDH